MHYQALQAEYSEGLLQRQVGNASGCACAHGGWRLHAGLRSLEGWSAWCDLWTEQRIAAGCVAWRLGPRSTRLVFVALLQSS